MREDVEPARRRLSFRRSNLGILLAWATLSVVLLTTPVPLWMPKIGLLAGGGDFYVYRDGARYLLDGQPLYAGPFRVWNLHYTYTPFSTVTFAPLAWLPDGSGRHIWLAINIVLLVLIVMQCWRMLGHRITPYLTCASALLAIACAFLEPVRSTLFFGQINLLLMLLVLWDTSRGERSRFKGIGIGIAAGIKLTPAYFVLYYLVLRQWRAASVAVATIAATVGVGWLVIPNDSWQYWTGKFLDYTRVSKNLAHPGNQSVRGAIVRLTGEVPPTWLWLLVDAGVVAVSMWIAVRLYRRGEPLLAVTVVGLSAAVVSPFTWSHHWVWFVPVIVYLVHRALTNRWWWLGAATLFVVMGSWAYSFATDTRPRVGLYLFAPKWIGWEPLVNLHLIVYAAVLIAAALIARRLVRNGPRTEAPATATAESVTVDA